MAEPIDSAVILQDVLNIHQELYMKNYTEQYARSGQVVNKYFAPASEIASGDGITAQNEHGPTDSVRTSTDVLSALASPGMFNPVKVKIRMNQQTPTASDFTRYSGSAQVTDIDIENAGRGAIVDLVQRVHNQVTPDYEEKKAVLRHLPRTAQLCSVNGTPKQNDRRVFSNCTATASNTAGMRIQISGGSPAYFKQNWRYDFYDSTGVTLLAGNVVCTDMPNTGDTGGASIGFAFTSSGTGVQPSHVSTGNLGSVTTGSLVYISGTKNQGPYSLGAYFGTIAATGDSFIGGVNRESSTYRWMVPRQTREDASSNSRITKSMFNDLQIAMNFNDEAGFGVTITSDLTIHQAMRDEIGEQSFIQLPITDDRMKRFAQFGINGLIYQSPAFGVVQIVADPLHPANVVRVISIQDWMTYYYGFKGLKRLPGDTGAGWYRMNDVAPNTGRGLVWKCDWYSLECDWCRRPWRCGQINKVSAA